MNKEYRYLEIRRMFKNNNKEYEPIWVIWTQNRQSEPNVYFRNIMSASVRRVLRFLEDVAVTETVNE